MENNTRLALSDGSGWFDVREATTYDAKYDWDGRNSICVATGSQWEHETLYRTKKGNWILHWSSQYEGVRSKIMQIDDADAARWLALNEYFDAIPGPLLKDLEI